MRRRSVRCAHVPPAAIAIRCDGHEQLGAGHVARCLPIAIALREVGLAPVLVGRYGGLGAWLAQRSGLPVREPDEASPCGVDPRTCAAALVDSYALGEEELCELAGALPIATVAEARRCPGAGVWIDYHLDRLGEEPTDRVLPGPAFAPLDPALAGRARPGREVREVLLTVGGSSAVRELLPLLAEEARAAFPGARLLVASGADLPGDDVERLPFPASLLAAVARVDAAVSAAGLTAYELACAGVPALVIPVAGNQRRVADGCRATGVALVAEPAAADLRAGLAELADPGVRERLADAGRRVFDGGGAARSARALTTRWSLE
jgi:UDP-2,4-diacetamido-2,4,6-trideoxy-beta-L-altropyranose hydrolase